MARAASVVKPDFTVTVERSDGSPALVAALFITEAGKVDVAVGHDAKTDLDGLRAILQSVEVSLTSITAWHAPEDLVAANRKAKSEGDSVPF